MPPAPGSHEAARLAAIENAALSPLEALAAGEVDEAQALAMIRHEGEMTVVAFTRASFLSLSTLDRPLTKAQINAGCRLQEAFFVGATGSSNAAQIERWLQRSMKTTQRDKDAAAFGQVMNVGDDSGPLRDYHAALFDAAKLLAWTQERVGRASWLLLELLLRLEHTPREIAQKLGHSAAYVEERLREALAELAGVLRDLDRHG